MSTQTVTLRLVTKNDEALPGIRQVTAEVIDLGDGAQQAGTKGEQGLGRVSNAADRTSTFVTRAKQAMAGFLLTFASLQGAQAAVQIADQYSNISTQLKLATNSQAEFAVASDQTYAIAQRTSTALASTAELYGRLARSTSDYGLGQFQLLKITETINQTFAVSGTAAANQANAITQLTQAFAGGVLRAEEFNSIIENSPRLAQAFADGMGKSGISVGELRKQVNDGKVDIEKMIGALQSQAAKIQAEFERMPLTIERGWMQITNALVRYVGQADQANGTSRSVAEAMSLLAQNFGLFADAAGRGVAIAAAYFLLFKAAPAIYLAASQAALAYATHVAAVSAAQEMGIKIAFSWAAAMRAAAGVAIVAFAGWQIGTWLRDNFEEARIAGLYFVESTLVGWERIKQGASIAWEFVKSAAINAVNAIRDQLADLVGFVADITDKVDIFGIGSGAVDGLRDLEGTLRPTSSAADQFRTSVAGINAETDKNIAGIRTITGDLLNYEYSSSNAADATNKLGAASTGAASATKGLTEEQKKAAEAAAKFSAGIADQIREMELQAELMRSGYEADQAAEIAKQRLGGASEQLTQKYLDAKQALAQLTEEQKRYKAALDEVLGSIESRANNFDGDLISLFDPLDGSAPADFAPSAEAIGRMIGDEIDSSGQQALDNVADGFINRMGYDVPDTILTQWGDAFDFLSSQSGDLFGGELKQATTQALVDGFIDGESVGKNFINTWSAAFKTKLLQAITEGMSKMQLGSMGSVGGVLQSAGIGYGAYQLGQSFAPEGSNLGKGFGLVASNPVTMQLAALDSLTGGSVFGTKWKTKTQELGILISDGILDATIETVQKRKKSLGRGTKTRIREDDASQLDSMLGDSFVEAASRAADAAKNLGGSIDNFTYQAQTSIKGLEGADLDAAIQALFLGATDALATSVIPTIADWQRENETLLDTLIRVSAEVTGVRSMLDDLGLGFNLTGEAAIAAADDLLQYFGGSLDAMSTAASTFYEKFVPEAERQARLAMDVQSALQAVNLSMPATREGFRALVQSLDATTDAGRRAIAVMLQTAAAADQVYAAQERAAEAEATRKDEEAKADARRAEQAAAAQARADEAADRARTQELERQQRADEQAAAAAERARDQERQAQQRAAEEAARLNEQRRDFERGLREQIGAYGKEGMELELYNARIRYQKLRDQAEAAGSRGSEVEELYSLERNAIQKKYADEALAEQQRTQQQAADALREAYRRQADALQETVNRFRGIANSLRDFGRELQFGDMAQLSPQARLDALRTQFNQTNSLAAAGDEQALRDLASVTRDFVSASREVNGANGSYFADLAAAQAAVNQAQGVADFEADTAQRQLDETRNLVSSLIDLDESVTSLDEAIADFKATKGGVVLAGAVAVPVVAPVIASPTVAATNNQEVVEAVQQLSATIEATDRPITIQVVTADYKTLVDLALKESYLRSKNGVVVVHADGVQTGRAR